MTIEQIRELYDVQPFQPFVMHLADGRAIPVRSREFIMSAPSGRTIIVFQPDDSMNIIDLLLLRHPASEKQASRRASTSAA